MRMISCMITVIVIFLALTMNSCTHDENKVFIEENTASSALSVTTSLDKGTTRSVDIREAIKHGDDMAVYALNESNPFMPYHSLTSVNVRATYHEDYGWRFEDVISLTNESARIYAVYPFLDKDGEDWRNIKLDMNKHFDYMYGVGSDIVNNSNPNAQIIFKHACALVRFRFKGYGFEKGKGVLTKIELGGRSSEPAFFYNKGTMDCIDGTITPTELGSIISENKNGILRIENDVFSESVDLAVIPFDGSNINSWLQFSFTIDNNLFYESNRSTDHINWERGKIYTYNVTVYPNQVVFDEEVSVMKWEEGTTSPIGLIPG